MIRTIASFLAIAGLLSADTLLLRNGSRVEGSFLGGDGKSIRFLVGSQVSTYFVSDIESIRFTNNQPQPPDTAQAPPAYPQQASNAPPMAPVPPGNNPAAPNTPPPSPPPPPVNASNYPPPPSRPVNEGYASEPAAPQPPTPVQPSNAGMEVPAGTPIVVRLIDPVNSERDNLGQSYRASVDQPVVVNGQTLIPHGADAVATLIDAQKSGKIEGRTVLTLDLKTITVNGRTYEIVTTGVPEASSSRGARSAKVIGGAAALGAIIGAAAGGGKGAAIGAGAGAGAGTAAEVATSGQKVKVPAETRLTFTLQNPIVF
jgi:hypothetical protein